MPVTEPRTSLTLMPVRAQDREAWAPLWMGYQTFYEVMISPDVTDATWRRLLDPDETVNGLLAWDGDVAIGLVHFIWHRSTWTTGDYCYLQDLFVDAAARGGGVGWRLINAVYVAAAERGCSRVHWLTHEANVDAMLLYDRIAQRSGFVQYRKLL